MSEVNGLLSPINPDSRVTQLGFYEANADDNRIVKFETVDGPNGKEYRFKVNARYAHLGENALRAVELFKRIPRHA